MGEDNYGMNNEETVNNESVNNETVNKEAADNNQVNNNSAYNNQAGGNSDYNNYNRGYNNGYDSNNSGYNNYNDYNNGSNNSGYNGNNYNSYNNYNNDYNNNYNPNKRNNNSGKKKVAVAICIVAAIGAVGIIGSGIVGAMGYIGKYSQSESSDKIAWNNQNEENKDGSSDNNAAEATTKPVSVTEAGGATIGGVSDVSGIVEAVMPSVVSITSTASVEGYSIFGQKYSQEIASAGTGFIVGENENELLLATNNHVVEGATGIQVTFNDESTAEAVVKGTDSQADLAVVAVKKKDLSSETKEAINVAVLGDSDNVKVGQIAIAIGNAQGMGQSVTVGYISAKNRELDMSGAGSGSTGKMNFIQTDAAINGGNSGGPLIDINGNVVGINSAKISDTQVEGMCFAIPISTAIPIINELMNRETISEAEKGYLGVSLQNIDSDAVEMYNVPNGVYVQQVIKGGAADKAGIKEGDIIAEVNGTEVSSSSAVTEKVTSYKAGTEIKLVIYRKSETGNGYEKMDVKATLVTAEEAGINKGTAGSNSSGDEDSGQKDSDDNHYGNDEMEDFFNDFFGR